MFAHLSATYALRAAALLPIAAGTDALTSTFNRQRGLAFVITTAARTAGSITAHLQCSFDDGATWVTLTDVTFTDGTNAMGTVNADGVMFVNRPVPTYLRVLLTPVAAFDGTVAVTVRSSDIIAV